MSISGIGQGQKTESVKGRNPRLLTLYAVRDTV
jgi:hypothetical protein